MSVAQTMAGAMGCASWRVRDRLLEYAHLAPHGGVITGGPSTPPTVASAKVLGLNEVGVTDAVMTTLWRCGPQGAAFAVSSGAEANHLGADIAIVDAAQRRILLYQAKLAAADGAALTLKSEVKVSQARRLRRRRPVRLRGVDYKVTGRLALYQGDHTPLLDRCGHCWMCASRSVVGRFDWERWWHWPGPPDPTIGREYYKSVISGRGCSPGGVLAARVSTADAIRSVDRLATWPWEFDLHHWHRGRSPLDRLRRAGTPVGVGEEFEPYEGEDVEPSADLAEELSETLAPALGIPASRRVYLIVLADRPARLN